MLNLSLAQAEIVNTEIYKAIQVLASAGSGKTRVLTERVRFLLQNTKKEGVIALTFTNKAAEEMATRLEDCEQAEDRVWIATIHSVAQRVLEKYGHTVGLPSDLHIYDRDQDRMEVFLQSLRDEGVDIDSYLEGINSGERKERKKILQNYMDIFSKIKRELLTEFDVSEQNPDDNIWKVFQDYQSALLNSGGIDYDDILVYAHKILLTHDWIAKVYRSKYKHICVDEAQDLNRAQYEFIKALCGDAIQSVLMVGDPNQMIYGFNGSSKDFFCRDFIADFSPQVFELKENYRSSKAVIQAANKLRPGAQEVLDYALEGKVEITPFPTEEDEAEWISASIEQLLSQKLDSEIEGDISLDKMVVIARNRFVFGKLEEALKEKGIPFSLRKGERQLERSTAFGKILDYAVRLKINSKDWVDGRKLCAVLDIPEPKEWGDDVLSAISENALSLNDENAKLYSSLIGEINQLDAEDPNIRKFIDKFKAKLDALSQESEWLTDAKSEELRLSHAELDEFGQSWTLFKRKGLGSSLAAFRNALALGQLVDTGPDKGLTLSTVHTMKGLEKDIVFLMGMCEGVFPDYRAQKPSEIDEERNSAFVAITRAKRWLFITYPRQRMMPWGDRRFQRVSRFVSEIE